MFGMKEILTMNTNDKVIEQKVLGSILIMSNGFSVVAKTLKEEMFDDKAHKEVFAQMASLYASGRAIKQSLVAYHLGDELFGMSTEALLSAMVASVSDGDASNLQDYAYSINDKWVRRDAAKFYTELAKDIQNKGKDVHSVLSTASLQTSLYSGHSEDVKITSLHDAMENNLNTINAAMTNEIQIGYDCGVDYITKLIGHLVAGQNVIIGAGTKVGKSAMALDIGLGLARSGPVLCFSFEMTAELIASRKAASETGISTIRQRSSNLTDAEYAKLDKVRHDCLEMKDFDVISQKMNIEEIFKIARDYKAKHGRLVAVIVDHLGLLKPLKGGGRKDWEVAAESAPILKEMAEELKCVTIGLSQLNKEVPYGKTMQDKINACRRPPSHHDLKGAISNDADHVLMPYREEAVLKNIEPARDTEDYVMWETAMSRCKDKGQIRLSLSREAVYPKTIPLKWIGERTKFVSFLESRGETFFEDGF